jgi:hypothetical protein
MKALCVHCEYDEYKRLIRVCDDCMEEFLEGVEE